MTSPIAPSQPVDYFRSERLVYRAWETPDDIEWLHESRMDAIAVANSSLDYVKPVSRAHVEDLLKRWKESKDALLSLVMCIPEEEDVQQDMAADNSAVGVENRDTSQGIRKHIQKQKQKLTPVGSIALTYEFGTRAAHNRAAMIGLNINADYRSKGYGSEAIEYVLRHAFQVIGLHRVAIGTASFNTGAVRLYDRLGFVRESQRRQALWYDGEWHDLIEWAILEDEWRAKKTKKP